MAVRILLGKKQAGRFLERIAGRRAKKKRPMEVDVPNLDRKSLEARSKEELIEWVIQGTARVKELEARVKELEARVKELEGRLKAPPKTSHIPFPRSGFKSFCGKCWGRGCRTEPSRTSWPG